MMLHLIGHRCPQTRLLRTDHRGHVIQALQQECPPVSTTANSFKHLYIQVDCGTTN